MACIVDDLITMDYEDGIRFKLRGQSFNYVGVDSIEVGIVEGCLGLRSRKGSPRVSS